MEIALDTPDTDYYIRSYSEGHIVLNTGSYQQSLVIFGDQLITNWPVPTIGQLTSKHLIDLLAYKPEIVLLGTGKKQVFPPSELLAPTFDYGIGIEIMSTTSAAKTYNILAAEGRNAMAALIVA